MTETKSIQLEISPEEIWAAILSGVSRMGGTIEDANMITLEHFEKLGESLVLRKETILTKLENFGNIAHSRNIPLFYDTPTGTDPDIVDWLLNAVVSTNPTPQGKWKHVDTENGTSEKTMLLAAQKMCLSHAVDVFTQELQNGTFDTLETYRIIFLEETDSVGNVSELVCRRRPNGKLRLSVHTVDPGRVWDGAFGAWFEQQ